MSDNDTFSAWNDEVKALADKLNASHDFEIKTKFMMGVLFPIRFDIEIHFKDGSTLGQSGSRFRTTFNNLQKSLGQRETLASFLSKTKEKEESAEEQVMYPESFTETVTLKDIAENVHPYHKEFIKKAVVLYEDFNHHCKIDFCQICDEALTDAEKSSLTSAMLNITCIKHREYADHFNLLESRNRAGYKGESKPTPDFSEFVKYIISSYESDKRTLSSKNPVEVCGICSEQPRIKMTGHLKILCSQ